MSPPGPIINAADLCSRIRMGDARAFRELFDAHYTPLRHFATMLVGSEDAGEDIVQGLFVYLWDERERWVVRGNLRSYLYSAVQRRALSHWRATRVRARHVQGTLREAAGQGVGSEQSPDEVVERAEVDRAYARAVAALPPRTRQAFELHCQHELSCREVGEIMGISHRTVEGHVGRALVAVRQALAPYLSVALILSLR